jgi:hypothetical protein
MYVNGVKTQTISFTGNETGIIEHNPAVSPDTVFLFVTECDLVTELGSIP